MFGKFQNMLSNITMKMNEKFNVRGQNIPKYV